MIKRVRATRFGCLRDFESTELTPIHAFIGPNDSGKSTILRLVRAILGVSNSNTPSDGARQTAWADIRALTTPAGPGWTLAVEAVGGRVLALEAKRDQLVLLLSPNDSCLMDWGRPPNLAPDVLSGALGGLGGRLMRLDPDALRQPSPLIPEGGAVGFLDDRGTGLPGVLDVILSRGDDAWPRIRRDFQALFDGVPRLRNVDQGTKEVVVALDGVGEVPAAYLSEGMLYYLAFLALESLSPVACLLVEEPENGLHPARIREVLGVLRRISERGTQVLMATHSPLVVNELKPDEVTIVVRAKGESPRLTRLCDTPNFEARSKVYALGELWLSYADGDLEKALLDPVPVS